MHSFLFIHSIVQERLYTTFPFVPQLNNECIHFYLFVPQFNNNYICFYRSFHILKFIQFSSFVLQFRNKYNHFSMFIHSFGSNTLVFLRFDPKNIYYQCIRSFSFRSVLRIHDILVWIRSRSGSGSPELHLDLYTVQACTTPRVVYTTV